MWCDHMARYPSEYNSCARVADTRCQHLTPGVSGNHALTGRCARLLHCRLLSLNGVDRRRSLRYHDLRSNTTMQRYLTRSSQTDGSPLPLQLRHWQACAH